MYKLPSYENKAVRRYTFFMAGIAFTHVFVTSVLALRVTLKGPVDVFRTGQA
jgi:hypothetical protein